MGAPDVYSISYPKSGRTWLRTLVGKVLCEHYGINESLLLRTQVLTEEAGLRTMRFSHDLSQLKLGFRYNHLPTRKVRYRNRRVVFLVREAKDTMVSSYFQATRRLNLFDGPITEFIQSERYGIRKYVQFLNIWHANQNVPQDFLLLTYEDMHTSPEAVVQKVLDFLGASGIPNSTIQNAVQFASFDNMQMRERRRQFGSNILRPRDVDDISTYKVRRGKIGSYTDYLSQEDITYIYNTIAQTTCPFLQRYSS